MHTKPFLVSNKEIGVKNGRLYLFSLFTWNIDSNEGTEDGLLFIVDHLVRAFKIWKSSSFGIVLFKEAWDTFYLAKLFLLNWSKCKWRRWSNGNFPEQTDDLRRYPTFSVPTRWKLPFHFHFMVSLHHHVSLLIYNETSLEHAKLPKVLT